MSYNLQNDNLLRALCRQSVTRTPLWIMRQAGRYLPEYRELRKKTGDFLTLCKTPELACEVTLQPLARFDLDAAIIFSDILTIPDAMGLGLTFTPGEGPQFERPLIHGSDIDRLIIPDPEDDLRYVMDAIRLTRNELGGKVPLIGFSGSPWTIATYMVEGRLKTIKKILYQQPEWLHKLLQILTGSVTAYLNAQIKAGAQAVMIFDTWGGILSTSAYQEFSLNYMQQIVSELIKENENRKVPNILFTKNGGQWLEMIADSGCDAVSLDWTVDINQARKRIGERVALQGNMEPCVLYAKPEKIREEVRSILKGYGKGVGHVFNLGHGILPDISIEHVSAMIDAVHQWVP